MSVNVNKNTTHILSAKHKRQKSNKLNSSRQSEFKDETFVRKSSMHSVAKSEDRNYKTSAKISENDDTLHSKCAGTQTPEMNSSNSANTRTSDSATILTNVSSTQISGNEMLNNTNCTNTQTFDAETCSDKTTQTDTHNSSSTVDNSNVIENNTNNQSTESTDSVSQTEVCLTASFVKNTMPVELEERKIQSLIDTGASMSCIQRSLLEKTIPNFETQIKPSTVQLVRGVGGELHRVEGAIVLPIKISGLVFEQEFIIIKELHHPLIIGLDFMMYYKCVVDFQHNYVRFTTADISVAIIQDSKLGYARGIKPQIIKANSETIIDVRISKGHKNETILLDPSGNLQGTNIVGARCLVTTKNNKTVMKLANPTNEDIYLSKSGILANVHVVDKDNVFCFDDCSHDNSTSNISNIDRLKN